MSDQTSPANTEKVLDVFLNINKKVIENIIGTVAEPDIPAKSPEEIDTKNQDTDGDKTKDDDKGDPSNSTSRELKSLLALSKEANLSTNLSHKRIDRKKELSKIQPPKFDTKRVSSGTNFKFPVTAEAELEQDMDNCDKNDAPSSESVANVLKRSFSADGGNEIDIEGAGDEAAKKGKRTFSVEMKNFKPNKDSFCWRCHRDGINLVCDACPRSYHQKCLKETIADPEHWKCPECVSILKAESPQTRSDTMNGVAPDHLSSLLKFAINRMIQCQGSEPFMQPVSDKEFPEYRKYIIQPMDLTQIEKSIKDNVYSSTQSFEADAKWLLHNSIIFNSYQSKLTYTAKSIVKICKQEVAEIENCPNCYLNANTKKTTWFVEVCPRPHLLVWAKLKGFPYWPAKVMTINQAGMADVRFFGAHDRAWVHYKECFLYSEKDPNTFKQKRFDIEKCKEELMVYVNNMKKLFGDFRFAPYKTLLDPSDEQKNLLVFLPKYKGPKALSVGNEKKPLEGQIVKSDDTISDIEDVERTKQTPVDVELNGLPVPEKMADFPDKLPDDEDSTFHEVGKNGDGVSDFNGAETKEEKEEDSIMEGYGTDDDMPSINLAKRKALVGTNEKTEDYDEDEDSDTQVPSDISLDKGLLRGNVRTRGGLHPSPGKLKILPRRASEADTAKRLSTEEPASPQKKTSRRNSVKSDSSRISEKISRLDISEDVEITLGKGDGHVSVSESGESSKSGSESGNDSKKKPVQVDIDNAEFSISPGNKLKISDKLIQRLSSESGSDVESRMDEVKRALSNENPQTFGPKSQTDILLEKFKDIVEREVVDFGLSAPVAQNEDANVENEPEGNKNGTKTDESAPCLTNVRDTTEKLRTYERKIAGDTVKTTSIPTSDPKASSSLESAQPSHEISLQNTTETVAAAATSRPEEQELAPEGATKRQKLMIQPAITEYALPTKNAKSDSLALSNGVTTSEEAKRSAIVAIVEDFEEDEVMDTLDSIQIDKNKIFNIIHSSLNQAKKAGDLAEKEATNGAGIGGEQVHPQKEVSGNKVGAEKWGLLTSVSSPDEIINSVAKPKSAVLKKRPDDGRGAVKSNAAQAGLKRKLSSDESSSPQTKVVKLVPIEKIMQKDHVPQETQHNRNKSPVTCPSGSKEATRRNSVQEIMLDDVKSEPESDDNFDESENLEAKKKYLSALNISEKTTERTKIKENEIRTRAKAEEKREKFRVVDNLTRVIDDVALNYAGRGTEVQWTGAEKRRGGVNIQEGEIYVKSFAKLKDAQGGQQRARKSFPIPSYIKTVSKPVAPKKDASAATKKDGNKSAAGGKIAANSTSKSSSSPNVVTSSVSNSSGPSAAPSTSVSVQKPSEAPITSMPHVILFPAPAISYGSPMMSPVLGMVTSMASLPVTPAIAIPQTPQHTSQQQLQQQALIRPRPSMPAPNVVASQNYIPQNDKRGKTPPRAGTSATITDNVILNELLSQPLAEPEQEQQGLAETPQAASSGAGEAAASSSQQEDDFAVLNGMIPEHLSRAISELLLRPPPRLRPRPPGLLSQSFDSGIPSSAGNVTTRVNSVAHRISDYFRGMLIETMEDLGKSANPEAKIISLQLELEAQRHRNDAELAEIRKNVSQILKDIQRSITEERERIVDETRATCEAEAIKRIEVAKSKQWCANCSKEAQFYCCWNTSYCDYPCQQKHWPQHMGKCTQNIEKVQNTPPAPQRPAAQPVILRPAVPSKPGVGPRIIAKPTKVYMNKSSTAPQKAYKTITSTGSHITVIETAPGSYELLGSGSIMAGKIYSSTFSPKFKAVISASSAGGGGGENRSPRPGVSEQAAKSPSCSRGQSGFGAAADEP